MVDLVERYVHQVGRLLPKKDRADIEEELRSLIHDQLDDRFKGAPSQADIASVLTELGNPRQMAASYNRDQYLVGPELYPYLTMVLRHVWTIVPTIVIFLNIFGTLISSQKATWLNLLAETLISALQATFTFSAVAVLIFALIQRVSAELDEKEAEFNPLNLPKVDDPRIVDRFEALFGIVFGTFVILVLFYFLHVGGFTLRFNLDDPGDVTPVPMLWLILMICAVTAMLILHLWVLWRERWNVALWLTETILEVFGMICLYFVVYGPLFKRILATVPSLANVPAFENLPEIIVILGALLTLTTRGSKLVALLNDGDSAISHLKFKRSE